jgi:hypothetical protein
LQVAGCRLQVAGCRLQVASCRLQVAGCRLQVAGCKLQVAGCKLQVAGCRLQVASCRLQVAGSLEKAKFLKGFPVFFNIINEFIDFFAKFLILIFKGNIVLFIDIFRIINKLKMYKSFVT